jgi:hypothetical protein
MISHKSCGDNDLLAELGVISYDAGVTDAEFWTGVGEQLMLQRTRMGLKNASAVQRRGGPNYKTIANNEAGQIAHLASLREHAEALGLSVVDLFQTVLSRDGDRPFTPEAQQIVAKFEHTTIAGRTALLALAQALPDEAPEGRSGLPSDQLASGRDTPRAPKPRPTTGRARGKRTTAEKP